MGFYAERVVPRMLDVACGLKVVQPLRRRVCDGLAGEVVEIGFGSGHNVPHYPASVTRVAAVEPSDVAWKLAAKRLGETMIPVQRSGLDGESLPFADHSYDAALRELRRVLRPGGTLRFLEHGLATDEPVRRWQRRLEPVQKRLFGGCHLTRPVVELLQGAGFVITEVDVFYAEGTPKPLGADSLGTALSP